jgi:hypothetical protein
MKKLPLLPLLVFAAGCAPSWDARLFTELQHNQQMRQQEIQALQSKVLEMKNVCHDTIRYERRQFIRNLVSKLGFSSSELETVSYILSRVSASNEDGNGFAYWNFGSDVRPLVDRLIEGGVLKREGAYLFVNW